MRLEQITQHYLSMTQEEQLEYVRGIRKRKHEMKPAQKKRIKKARKPAVNKARKLLEGLTAAERAVLLEELDDGSNN